MATFTWQERWVENEPGSVRDAVRAVSRRLAGETSVGAEVVDLCRRGDRVFGRLRDPDGVRLEFTAPAGLGIGPGRTVLLTGEFELSRWSAGLRLVVSSARDLGPGTLAERRRIAAARFEADPRPRRPLPWLPAAVGLVTPAGSQAERDFLAAAHRRAPGVPVVVSHRPTAGARAARDMADALTALARAPGLDVVVVARGGGAASDLAVFDDATLCRAARDARVPVVSAVGHEADDTLLDRVADLRAPTPSSAAALVLPDAAQETARLRDAVLAARADLEARLRDAVEDCVAYAAAVAATRPAVSAGPAPAGARR